MEQLGKRERILKAAARVFAEHGFHQATIDQISEEAQVGKGTVYLYFRSKEGLFNSLLVEGLGLVVDGMRQVASTVRDPKDRLEKLVSRHLLFIERNLGMMKVLFQQVMPQQIDDVLPEVRQLVAAYKDLYVGALEKGVAEGHFRAHNCEIVALSLLGALNQIGTNLAEGRLQSSTEECQHEILSIFLSGIERKRGTSNADSQVCS